MSPGHQATNLYTVTLTLLLHSGAKNMPPDNSEVLKYTNSKGNHSCQVKFTYSQPVSHINYKSGKDGVSKKTSYEELVTKLSFHPRSESPESAVQSSQHGDTKISDIGRGNGNFYGQTYRDTQEQTQYRQQLLFSFHRLGVLHSKASLVRWNLEL